MAKSVEGGHPSAVVALGPGGTLRVEPIGLALLRAAQRLGLEGDVFFGLLQVTTTVMKPGAIQ